MMEEKNTKACRYCKTEIDADAKICPNCRKKQKAGWKPVVLAGIAVLLLASCFSGEKSEKTEIKNVKAAAEKQTEIQVQSSELETESEKDHLEMVAADQVLLDWSGLKITAKELTADSIWGKGIKVLIENDSDKNLGVSCNALIVNDYMIFDIFSETVAAGKKSNDTIYLSSRQLNASGIDTIGEIELYFHVFDGDSYTTLYDSERVVIQTSEYEHMDTEVLHEGTELLNQGGVRIVGKYVDETSFWGNAVLLYIENNSGKNIRVSCDDMSINGYMVTPFFSCTVYDGKKAVDDIGILSSDLEENDIKELKDFELKFCVRSADSYQVMFESDVVSFSVK